MSIVITFLLCIAVANRDYPPQNASKNFRAPRLVVSFPVVITISQNRILVMAHFPVLALASMAACGHQTEINERCTTGPARFFEVDQPGHSERPVQAPRVKLPCSFDAPPAISNASSETSMSISSSVLAVMSFIALIPAFNVGGTFQPRLRSCFKADEHSIERRLIAILRPLAPPHTKGCFTHRLNDLAV
jgi:hypothetical protein